MSQQQAQYVAPQTASEKYLCEVWQQLLGLSQVGVRDNFFELGGHSLLAMELTATLSRHFNLTLPLKTVFEVTDLSALAAFLDALSTVQSSENNNTSREVFEL